MHLKGAKNNSAGRKNLKIVTRLEISKMSSAIRECYFRFWGFIDENTIFLE